MMEVLGDDGGIGSPILLIGPYILIAVAVVVFIVVAFLVWRANR